MIITQQPRSIKNMNTTTESNNQLKHSKRPPCQICGKPSTNVFFATYVCDSEECIDKAREARGGPAGHKKDPKRWMEQNE
jgi:hypothetical protein